MGAIGGGGLDRDAAVAAVDHLRAARHRDRARDRGGQGVNVETIQFRGQENQGGLPAVTVTGAAAQDKAVVFC